MHLGVFTLTPLFLTKLDTNFVQAWCSNDGVLITKLKDNKKQGYEPYDGDSPLHPYDYPYFHKNIRVNVNNRVNSFLTKKEENMLDFCQLRSALGATTVVIVGISTFLICVCLYFCQSS